MPQVSLSAIFSFPLLKRTSILDNWALLADRWIISGCFCLLTTSKYMSALNQSLKQQATKVPKPSHVQLEHMELSYRKVRQFNVFYT